MKRGGLFSLVSVYDVLEYVFNKFDVRIPFHHLKSSTGLWDLAHEVFNMEVEAFLGNAVISSAIRVWWQQPFRQVGLLLSDTCAHFNPSCVRFLERGHLSGHQLSASSRPRWRPGHQRSHHILLNLSDPGLLPHQPEHRMGVRQSPYFTGVLCNLQACNLQSSWNSFLTVTWFHILMYFCLNSEWRWIVKLLDWLSQQQIVLRFSTASNLNELNMENSEEINEPFPPTVEEAQMVYEDWSTFSLSLRNQHILSLISSTEIVAHFSFCLFCQHLHIKHDTFQKNASAMSVYIDTQMCQQKKQLHSLMHKYIHREPFLTFHQIPLNTMHEAVYLWAMLSSYPSFA